MYNEIDQLPTGLLDIEADQLLKVLKKPTLIHMQGRHAEPLFVSVLLHGNETAGWDAIRRLLKRYQPGGGEKQLPRTLSLFIGNIEAAAEHVRTLDRHPDFNRVWPGCEEGEGITETAEHAMMTEIAEKMAQRNVFASIDVHNNTGINPHYACVNRIDNRFLHLATLFSRTVVYFIRPCGVQSNAMAKYCPAVTLECGKTGQSLGVEHALEYLDAALHLTEHPTHAIAPHDIDLFHTVAIVKVPQGIDFSFSNDGATIDFADDLERLNFREIPSGTLLAKSKDATIPLNVSDEHGKDVTAGYIENVDGELRVRRSLMPSMLTTDSNAVRLDCLCYFMERYQSHLP